MDGHRLIYVICGQRPSFLWPAHHFDGHDMGMAMPMAPGAPAMFVFLNEAIIKGCEGWAQLVL